MNKKFLIPRCAKNLQQWDVLSDYGKQQSDRDLQLEW